MKHKRIPQVVMAALAVGSGCGDEASDFDEFVSLLCQEDQCENPTYFEETYGSIAACEAAFSAAYERYFDAFAEIYGRACSNALLKLATCETEGHLAYCRDSSADYSSCSAEETAYFEACDIGALP